jgi:hypothetical protein
MGGEMSSLEDVLGHFIGVFEYKVERLKIAYDGDDFGLIGAMAYEVEGTAKAIKDVAGRILDERRYKTDFEDLRKVLGDEAMRELIMKSREGK